jgi:hypothetical protein
MHFYNTHSLSYYEFAINVRKIIRDTMKSDEDKTNL